MDTKNIFFLLRFLLNMFWLFFGYSHSVSSLLFDLSPQHVRATRAVYSRRFLRELDEAPGGNNLYYIYSALASLHR